MRGITHILTGIIAGIVLYDNFLSVVLTALGSLLPDIDNSGSLISSNTRIKLLSKIFVHRGFFHSLLIPALFYFLANEFSQLYAVLIPLTIGYCVHIFGDSLTPKGVHPLYPLKTPLIRGNIETYSLKEKFIFILLLVITVYALTRRLL